MLLAEQERILSAEQNLISDSAVYSTHSQTPVTIHDYGNITVPAGGSLVLLSLDTADAVAGPAEVAIKIGSLLPVAGFSYQTHPVTSKHIGAAVWLSAGTYDISVLGWTATSSVILQIMNMQVGLAQFNDLVGSPLTHYSSATNNISLTVSARTTPAGPLNQAVYAVDIGSNGGFGVEFAVSVDGVNTPIFDDKETLSNMGPYQVVRIYVPLSVGTSHTITIHLTGSTVADASVIACPWILTSTAHIGHQPVTFNFTQLSTFYVDVCPLFADDQKGAFIGSQKSVTFGASDYYGSSQVNFGPLAFSYSFSSVNILQGVSWMVNSGLVLGACIDTIAVDIQ